MSLPVASNMPQPEAMATAGRAFLRSPFRRSAILGLCFGLAMLLIGVALREALGMAPGKSPYLTLLPVIALTACFAGLRPAVACASASLVTAWYFFVPPFESLAIKSDSFAPLALFV